MKEIQQTLDYADEIAEWFLDLGEMHCRGGELENGLRCTQLGATILCRQSRRLASNRVEANLLYTAARLHEYSERSLVATREAGAKAACLHVLDEALPAGGLTAMAMRWIRNDRSGRAHSVALLSQQVAVPESLLQTVLETGGRIYRANPVDSFLSRAAWLRRLARDQAECVVLHIGVTDVICGVAFGIDGGPPIVLVNHAAHIFWTGSSISDLVVNCRGSALESLWTTKHRSAPGVTVPIPLPESDSPPDNGPSVHETRSGAKDAIGIPTDAVAILTVGAAFKYSPVGELDFLAALEDVLKQLPKAILLVAGFQADNRWREASERLGSRIRNLGVVTQAQLATVHQATDIYVEGFPFGSTTALLEAGLKGIAVVLPPAQCPPPYTTDGVALDGLLNRPATVEHFKRELVRLGRSPSARLSCGDDVRRAIQRHHTGDGWRRHLQSAFRALPPKHSVRLAVAPDPTPAAIHEYWFTFVSSTDSSYEETLEHAITRALLMGVRPRLTKRMIEACKRHRTVRSHRTIPLPLLVCLVNFILPLLPATGAARLFRVFSFLFRKSLLARLRMRASGLLAGTASKRSWYEDYRNARS